MHWIKNDDELYDNVQNINMHQESVSPSKTKRVGTTEFRVHGFIWWKIRMSI